ncbi:hypothetical protein PCANC_03191 [Puccinia coronata f. sp. avenae]|uniref:Uncharacterized protein n=1 Tax=Puccinia coronata f. sp. avenae TaxID=200324 RepID=A0A2N5V5U8_9BASI|nr:hypothetical protein PCANC_03191 [Puccinia coronata f. sp. avenae]PLW45358.1 hypothetical protein PCASD_03111 [Puccinia coronata f. sp. avenae]
MHCRIRITRQSEINSYPVDPPDISGSIQNPTGGSARYPLGPEVAAESCARPSGAGTTWRRKGGARAGRPRDGDSHGVSFDGFKWRGRGDVRAAQLWRPNCSAV